MLIESCSNKTHCPINIKQAVTAYQHTKRQSILEQGTRITCVFPVSFWKRAVPTKTEEVLRLLFVNSGAFCKLFPIILWNGETEALKS